MEIINEIYDKDLSDVKIDFGSELPSDVIIALKLLGKKWSLPILYLLHEKDLGFSDIKKSLGENVKVSSNMLSIVLTELQDLNLIEKRIISDSPLRVEYISTVFGRDLCDLCQVIGAFGKKYLSYNVSSI